MYLPVMCIFLVRWQAPDVHACSKAETRQADFAVVVICCTAC